MSKFAKFLMFYILGILISDCPIEEATINTGFCREWSCDSGDCIVFEKRCDEITSSPANSKCILPPYPDHGRYNAPMGLRPGDAIPNVSLTFSCDWGYNLRGNRLLACVRGTWLAEPPTCSNQCKPLKSTSVDFKCYKRNSALEISCDLPQDSNSHAKATCKDSYYLEPPPKDLICVKGNWDYMPYCIPECGTVAPEGETLIINGERAKINEFPWHVGLYDKTSTPILQICGGSIFTPKLVLTAAHCVYKDLAGLYPASSFAVAAGKLYRAWKTFEDEEKYVQKIDVMKIWIPDRYKGAINAHTADVAVLVLERSFVLSNVVRPVCIRLDSEDNLAGQFGRVAGWGLTAEDGHSARILRTVRLPFVSFLDCYRNSPESFRPLITSDKICAGYTNGTALCKGDSGGGLVFSRQDNYQDLYYIYGIVSTSPRNKALTSCSAFAYTAFTNIMTHQKWLQDICLREWGCDNGGCIPLETRCNGNIDYCNDRSDKAAGFCSAKELSTTNRCKLPPYPDHGNYTATAGNKPGDVVSYTTLTYSCDVGYSINGEGSRACIMGTWFVDIPSCKQEVCHTPMGTGICKPITDCPQPLGDLDKGVQQQLCDSVGKRAVVCCANNPVVSDENAINPAVDCGPIPANATKVKKTGEKAWDKCIDYLQYVYPCEPTNTSSARPEKVRRYQCHHEVTDLVVRRHDTEDREFPHMALLGFDTQEVKDADAWPCGGTVISERYVMTTAYCTNHREYGYVMFVRVGITSLSSPIDRGRTYKVAEIIRHPDFKPPSSYDDLALIKTTTTIKFDDRVYPACLHTGNTVNDANMVGTGWGKLDFLGESNDILQKVTVVKFTAEECNEIYGISRKHPMGILPESQFCAGPYTDAKDMCQGNGGGPIQIFNLDVTCMYTVIGVTAFGKGCGKVSVPGVYTRVSHYVPWIESVVWP